jgi:hypothetical protein
MKFIKVLSGYINDSKNGDGKYLSIKNNTDEDVVIEAGKSIFLNMTPKAVRDKNPNVPMFSKSLAVPDETNDHDVSEKVADEIPF